MLNQKIDVYYFITLKVISKLKIWPIFLINKITNSCWFLIRKTEAQRIIFNFVYFWLLILAYFLTINLLLLAKLFVIKGRLSWFYFTYLSLELCYWLASLIPEDVHVFSLFLSTLFSSSSLKNMQSTPYFETKWVLPSNFYKKFCFIRATAPVDLDLNFQSID